MPLLQGQIDLILTNDPINLQIQDEVNIEKLKEQLNEQAEHLVGLYGYDIKLPQKASKSKNILHKKPKVHNVYLLERILQQRDTKSLELYVKSVLNKLFPKDNQLNDHQLLHNRFGSYNAERYEYVIKCRPLSDDNKTFDFNVKCQEYNGHMGACITWNFTYNKESNKADILTSDTFAYEILYALSESPFLQYAFTLHNKSYSRYTKHDKNITLKLIDYHFAADLAVLKDEINDMTELVEDDGDLLPLEIADSLLNYDGWGYLCKEVDGKIYNSYIVPDMDYELPKLYAEYFTHIYWYNK
jgi:hypothetical protein